jgi:hypothetical protein
MGRFRWWWLLVLTNDRVTGIIGTSMRDYFDNRAADTATLPADTYVTVPTAIANFRSNYADEGTVPREWPERVFRIARFTDMPVGGHFAAVEESPISSPRTLPSSSAETRFVLATSGHRGSCRPVAARGQQIL